jgi:hypothetical protein
LSELKAATGRPNRDSAARRVARVADNREFNREVCENRPFCVFRRRIRQQIPNVAAKFPTQPNREFLSAYQGIFSAEQVRQNREEQGFGSHAGLAAPLSPVRVYRHESDVASSAILTHFNQFEPSSTALHNGQERVSVRILIELCGPDVQPGIAISDMHFDPP